MSGMSREASVLHFLQRALCGARRKSGEAMTTAAAVSGRAPDQILASQRAAFLRDGPPSLQERRADLKKLRAVPLGFHGSWIADS
jgi:hypothetical protein